MTHPEDGATRVAGPGRSRRPSSRAARLLGGTALLAGVALVAYAAGGGLDGTPSLTTADIRRTVEEALASQRPDPAWSVPVYQAIAPSMVLVQVRHDSPEDAGRDSGRPGLGSAVVVDDQGTILTAYHVIEGATAITVTFADGTRTSATVVTEQPENDIAVLQPAELPEFLVPAVLGNPRSLPIGSEAYIVGHPSGLAGSMSSGIISAFERSFRVPDTDRVLSGLIQVDAAVNPGNSGGPLLDRAGRVIGIVTALINPSGEDSFAGIGLAVPIDVAGGAAGLPPY
jgi:S1-C subfamily serine protease